MVTLKDWTEECKDQNCKLFIKLFGNEPPLEELKDRYYDLEIVLRISCKRHQRIWMI